MKRALVLLLSIATLTLGLGAPAQADRVPHQGCITLTSDGFTAHESWMQWNQGYQGYSGGSFRHSDACGGIHFRARGIRFDTSSCVQMRLAIVPDTGLIRHTSWSTVCPTGGSALLASNITVPVNQRFWFEGRANSIFDRFEDNWWLGTVEF